MAGNDLCTVLWTMIELLRTAHIRACIEAIGSFFEDEAVSVSGHTGIIIGSNLCIGHGDRHDLGLSGSQSVRLFVAAENAGRLAEPALWCLTVDLDNLFATVISGIGDFDSEVPFIGQLFCASDRNIKGCIGKTKAKRIENLIAGKCLKVAVSDINILGIEVSVWITKIGRASCRERV